MESSSPKRRKLDSNSTTRGDDPLPSEILGADGPIPLLFFALVIEFVEESEFHSLIRAVPFLYTAILTQFPASAQNVLFTLRQSKYAIQTKNRRTAISKSGQRFQTRLLPPQPFVRRLRATLVVFDYPECDVGMYDEPPRNKPDDGISGMVGAEFCGSSKYVEDDYCSSAKNIGISSEVGSGWDSIGLCGGTSFIARRFPQLREVVIDVRHSTCDGNSRTFVTVDEIELGINLKGLSKLEIVQFEVGAIFPISGIFHPHDSEKLKKSLKVASRGANGWMYYGSKPPKYRKHSLSFRLSGLPNLREIRCGFGSREVEIRGMGETGPVFDVSAYDCPKLETMITERPLHYTSSLVVELCLSRDQMEKMIRQLKGSLVELLRQKQWIESVVLPKLEVLGMYTVPTQWTNSLKFGFRASQLPNLRTLELFGAVEAEFEGLAEFGTLEELKLGDHETTAGEIVIPNIPNLQYLEIIDCSDKSKIETLPNLRSLVIERSKVSVKGQILGHLRYLKIVSGFLLSPDADPEACREPPRTMSQLSSFSSYSRFDQRRKSSMGKCITKITQMQFPMLESFVYSLGENFWSEMGMSSSDGLGPILEIGDGIGTLRKVIVRIQVEKEGSTSSLNEDGFVVPLQFQNQVEVVKWTGRQ